MLGDLDIGGKRSITEMSEKGYWTVKLKGYRSDGRVDEIWVGKKREKVTSESSRTKLILKGEGIEERGRIKRWEGKGIKGIGATARSWMERVRDVLTGSPPNM